jgi:beta-N-acetylhexosaminidase
MVEDLGLHFIVGVAGSEISLNERNQLVELKPAGIIIFKNNVTSDGNWMERLRSVIIDAKQAIGRSRTIVSIDHEGGRVHRLQSPITHFPAASTWGDKTEAIGRQMGYELRSLGINVNYAPSLDVLSEATNQVIGDRSFGGDPVEVSERGIQFLRGLNSSGVVGCGKHFPGHGGTVKDSHFELPVLDRSESDIYQIDLPPFVAAIQSGLSLMMTSHVVYTALDPDLPATLSSKIITGLLRGQLGFTGCVVSDALEMKAMAGTGLPDLAERFIQAGGDLFLLGQEDGITTPLEKALKLRDELGKRAGDSEEFSSLLSASAARIRTFLNSLR